MFAISVRVRPWRDRCRRSSSGRSTRRLPSSRTIRMSGWNDCSSWPRGPFTATRDSSTDTWTPPGTAMGCLPIRDMLLLLPCSRLPDVGQDFATDAELPGLAIGENASGCRQDSDAEPPQHPRDVVSTGVDAFPRLGDALDAGDGALPPGPVLEPDVDRPLLAL